MCWNYSGSSSITLDKAFAVQTLQAAALKCCLLYWRQTHLFSQPTHRFQERRTYINDWKQKFLQIIWWLLWIIVCCCLTYLIINLEYKFVYRFSSQDVWYQSVRTCGKTNEKSSGTWKTGIAIFSTNKGTVSLWFKMCIHFAIVYKLAILGIWKQGFGLSILLILNRFWGGEVNWVDDETVEVKV